MKYLALFLIVVFSSEFALSQELKPDSINVVEVEYIEWEVPNFLCGIGLVDSNGVSINQKRDSITSIICLYKSSFKVGVNHILDTNGALLSSGRAEEVKVNRSRLRYFLRNLKLSHIAQIGLWNKYYQGKLIGYECYDSKYGLTSQITFYPDGKIREEIYYGKDSYDSKSYLQNGKEVETYDEITLWNKQNPYP